MSADFAPIFQKKFNDKVIPGLLMVLDDHANPRTQAHAGKTHKLNHIYNLMIFCGLGAAMVNFAEACPKEILKMYLEPILTKLEGLLNTKIKIVDGRKLVLEQIVTTIAAVADTVEELFVPYYDR